MPLLVDPFDKLTEDLKSTFRPQREWVDKRGLLLVTAHFLSGAGAGTWLFAWLLGLNWGLAIGWVLVAGGAVAHLLFLGKPLRFWRIVRMPQTSWISRGLLSISLFLLTALLYLLPGYFPGLPWNGDSGLGQALLVISLIATAGIFVYKGFVYAVAKAIPFWNTPLLPPLYIAYGLRGGLAVLFVASAIQGRAMDLESAKALELWMVLSTAILLLFYMGVMAGAGVTTAESIRHLVRGPASLPFYLGAVAVGLIIPVAFGIVSYFSPLTPGAMSAVALASLVGDFYIKYCVARAGIYLPVTVRFPARAH
ncbi:MAG: DmsC/YnfH family molybdoenzyme membrane anchor subunit [Dehalococcoidia bacterium]